MIRYLAETGSTNADLACLLSAGNGAAEGVWLVADRQTAGRGRQGRAWLDGIGNFMGSTAVLVIPGDPPAHTLALVAGLAAQRTIGALLPEGAEARLKWPNDVMIGRAKLAGILLERAGNGVVVGIGVNLVRAPIIEGRETIALAGLGVAVDRNTFAEALAEAFAAELAAWRGEGIAPVIARWLAAAHPVGTQLLVGEPGEVPLEGQFGGLDAQGALILRLPDGTRQTIHAGEVRLRPAH